MNNFRVPKIIRSLYPSEVLWDIDSQSSVYLTFDDGPHPVVTPWVLKQLEKYGAKATFFCLGKNVEQYPETYQMILDAGHSVGNHTYSHQKGFRMSTLRYIEDVAFAANYIHSELFRPPYGQISRTQIKRLSQHYRIVMWTVMSRDYSQYVNGEACFLNATKGVEPGAIIGFHDSLKSFDNLKYALPKVLQFYKERNINLRAIKL
ncbi:MAG: polysaccharide deacetylase family protein [Rikenellaceae bacterium]|nr:polysaccharide deacetylase family protein [Rikenellaceae bacterium]MBO5874314.1 polysaccharide deacetylase family protein [Rikenellaceae bacterium]